VVSAVSAEPERRAPARSDLAPGLRAVTSPVAGNLWKLLVEPGAHVQTGAIVAIVEAMKTEIAVHASSSGTVYELCATPGASVMPGDRLAVIALE
jgi:biotin carboxyl carrier protein